jgi:hypothetical protein
MTGDEEDETQGFGVAPPYRAAAAWSLPRKIEIHVVRDLPIPFAGLSQAFTESMAGQFRPVLDSLTSKWTRQFSEAFSLHIDRLIPHEAFEGLRESVPQNWQEIHDAEWDVDWDAALATMNEGIPLIWVPGAPVVRRLLRAGNAEARLAILKECRHEIANDCAAVLEDVTAHELLPLAGLAADASRALRERHCAASQALSANVFDTWLRGAARRGILFSFPPRARFRYQRVRAQMHRVNGDVRLAELKASGALTPVIMALAEFDPDDGVAPTSFGRHATAHAAGPEQYSDTNAVIALMLTTSVLRQAQASGW